MTAPPTYRVVVTHRAKQDLRAIVRWMAEHDAAGAGEHVLDEVLKTCEKLAMQPERGAYPAELLVLGIRRYRQVFFKPYRVVYRVDGDQVAVLLIADGRRDLKTLLERRLLSM
ncbi:MAG: type II toxin-antitoxin system RelE/ParE family toxin [Burkholderiales bacterium]